MKCLIDSSAWIEYLSGSKKGEKVNSIFKEEDIYAISMIISSD